MKKGFSLIELLVFVGIFSVIIGSFITILVTMLGLQTNQSGIAEVNQQGEFLLQQIQYYVSSARLIDMTQDVATSTLKVRGFLPTQDPTSFTVATGTVYLQQGAGASLQTLTSNKVSVTGLSFTRHFNVSTSSANGAESVSFSFTMTATTTKNTQYSQLFQSSALVSASVGKIVMIQQSSTVSNNPSVSALSAKFATNNQTSSLLLAVVANTTSSASVTLSDSAGNAWTQIATTSYPAYNTKLTLFAALNAKNSSNTVSSTLGAGAGYASLFIYEYRGAATSSSLDASSTQLQPNTQNPSSGSVSPTSTAELLFGVTYNGNTAEIPVAGSGFIMRTSSTVSHVFVEDMTQYITSAVAASWQYSGTAPSSSVLIATFK